MKVTLLFVGQIGSGRALLKSKIQQCLKEFSPHESADHFTVNGQSVEKGHTLSFDTDVIIRRIHARVKTKQTTTQTKKEEKSEDTDKHHTN